LRDQVLAPTSTTQPFVWFVWFVVFFSVFGQSSIVEIGRS
jgi:hypothetical protein